MAKVRVSTNISGIYVVMIVDIKSKSLILSFKDNKLIKLKFINSDFNCYITCALECFFLS